MSESVRSDTDEIQFDLPITMFVRPQIEWRAINFVDEWCCQTVAREINSLDVVLTGIAGLDTKMIEFRRMKVAEFGGTLFTAMRADDPAKLPRM